jgi:hypothetical protein
MAKGGRLFGVQRVEVRVMRKPEAVLEIISDRGKELP